jgi:hypothetical protein
LPLRCIMISGAALCKRLRYDSHALILVSFKCENCYPLTLFWIEHTVITGLATAIKSELMGEMCLIAR